jgi:TorA maturation chaperone TorD
LRRRPAPEEAGRADFYALLARLFHSAPDAALLSTLATAAPIPAEGDPALSQAWARLVQASAAMHPDAAAEEYEVLFTGVGKSRVSLYAGRYSGATAVEHPRVRIQNDLAALGLERPQSISEPEDHFAGLFDVMRVLAGGGAGRDPADLAEQRRFYEAHVGPGVRGFLAAVGSANEANYYRHVAAVAAAFVALEEESFKLD